MFLMPAVVPITGTVTVHVPFGASVAPERCASVGPTDVVPLQVVPGGEAKLTPRPLGRKSSKAIPFSVTSVFGFWMVNDSVAVPFSGI